MEQIIETIKRIEKSRAALRQAIADNGLATSPRLKDLSLIQKIYEIFEDMKGKEIKVNDRKEFIFGGKMPQGLRRAITKATKVTCASVISATCTELMVLYTTYSDFRQGVDNLMDKVLLSMNL